MNRDGSSGGVVRLGQHSLEWISITSDDYTADIHYSGTSGGGGRAETGWYVRIGR